MIVQAVHHACGRILRKGVPALLAGPLLTFVTAAPAQAHPLGNFTVNRYDGLRLLPDRIQDTAVVDTAEIPSLQDRAATDTDHDGRITDAEAAARAVARCAELAAGIHATADGKALTWSSGSSTLQYRSGAAGLPTARLTCSLTAHADLSRRSDLVFDSGADSGRVGWKEITAVGDRIRLAASSVPAASVSDALLAYPTSMLSQPLDTVHAAFTATPSPTTAGAAQSITDTPGPAASIKPGTVLFPGLQRWLSTLTGSRDLGIRTGALAFLVSLLLGAGHALLPGHAKLVMAVGMAEGGGRTKGAIAAGTVVTATHTAGVLLTGLAITTSMALAGDRLLGDIQAAGGLIIAGLGLGLVVTAANRLRGRQHGGHGHDHGHPHRHHHEHSHHHGSGRLAMVTSAIAGGLVPSPSALVMLLGAVAIGRTPFGVLLVIGYGLGMALTLTAVGLAFATGASRLSTAVERIPQLRTWTAYGTLATATAVLAIGLTITVRSGMA